MEVLMQEGDTVGQDAKAVRSPSVAAAGKARHQTPDHDFVMVHGDSNCSRDQARTRHPSNLIESVSQHLLAVLPRSIR